MFLLLIVNDFHVRWAQRVFGPFQASPPLVEVNPIRDECRFTPSNVHMVLTSSAPQPAGLANSPMLYLILGGAAVHRCDNRLVCRYGFSRWGRDIPL